MPDRKGSILIITLWILAILVVFSLGLARRASLNLRIVSYQRDKLKADYLARAGVKQAIALLEKGAHNTKLGIDTLSACGVDLAGRQPEEIFSRQWDGKEGSFRIGRSTPGGFAYGFQDEESRINLNGLGVSGLSLLNTEALLKELCRAKHIDNYEALAEAAAKWISPAQVDNQGFKKGTDFFRQEELLAALENFYTVSDQKDSEKNARQVYNDLEDAITVFAEKLNINTASDEVLTAMICSAAGSDANSATAANRLAGAIQDRRSSAVFDAPGLEAFNTGDMDADALFVSLKPYLTCKSEYFRFTVVGLYRGAAKEITVIYHRSDPGKIVYWHEK